MASKFKPEDFISIMPDNVVTDILHRLPLLDAVRTSTLSRNWRFKWTLLSHLKFDDDFFVYLTKTKGNYSYWKTISRLVLHLKGDITKCVLAYGLLDVEDIHNLILYLSKKGINDLTLTEAKPLVKLPTNLFSCLQLKHLNICGWGFRPPLGFHGFPNLLSLELRAVIFGNVKLVEIAKLQNLKILFLSLSHLETTSSCSIFDNVFELVGYLPKLQDLGVDFKDYRVRFTEVGAKRKFPTAFPFLKALKLTNIDFGNGIMLSCALEMIRHFPNVQNIVITSALLVADPLPFPIPKVEYNMMKLQSLVFRYLKDIENEVCLIKYLLACSPSLSKIDIQCHWCLEPCEQLIFAKKLLKLRRASTAAEINFNLAEINFNLAEINFT